MKRKGGDKKENRTTKKKKRRLLPTACFGAENNSKSGIDFVLKAGREMESPLIFRILP